MDNDELFLVTPKGYFFRLEIQVDWMHLKDNGCFFTFDIEEMYKKAVEVNEMEDLDEVYGCEYTITWKDGFFYLWDDRDCGDSIHDLNGQSIEDWILNFSL